MSSLWLYLLVSSVYANFMNLLLNFQKQKLLLKVWVQKLWSKFIFVFIVYQLFFKCFYFCFNNLWTMISHWWVLIKKLERINSRIMFPDKFLHFFITLNTLKIDNDLDKISTVFPQLEETIFATSSSFQDY